jgi:hypothetical protein
MWIKYALIICQTLYHIQNFQQRLLIHGKSCSDCVVSVSLSNHTRLVHSLLSYRLQCVIQSINLGLVLIGVQIYTSDVLCAGPVPTILRLSLNVKGGLLNKKLKQNNLHLNRK